MNVVRFEIKRCPICGGRPFIEQVAPWPPDHGSPPWAAGCYRQTPFEHFVGINGDTEPEARQLWNAEADKVASLANGRCE